MKHAGSRAFDALEGLLGRVRAVAGAQERTRGVFYRRSKPFLHFHEDPAGLFADLRVAGDWVRFPVNTAAQRAELMRRLVALIHDSDREMARSSARALNSRNRRLR